MALPNGRLIAYQLAVTYRCNSACKWCVQHLDVIEWKQIDTDVTEREIRVASTFLRKYDITVGKLRVTGGEPLLHPDLPNLLRTIDEVWGPRVGWFRTYTNGTIPLPRGVPGRFSVVPLTSPKKTDQFTPFNVSPADLGIEPRFGFVRECVQQLYCGRWFDCFGFSSCGVAGVLGAMFGEDCYEPLPVLMGRPSVCQHCLFSLPKRDRHRITRMVKAGKIPEITKSFQRAVERWHDDPPSPRKFLERLPEEYLPEDTKDASRFRRSGGGSSRAPSLEDVPVRSV